MSRRTAERWREGRLAEIFGSEALDYDRRTRLMMFRGPFDAEEWTSYHPDAERLFSTHARGVNAYIEQNRDNLPLEFQLTGVVPEPWTAQTSLLRWAALGVPSIRGHAIHEMQLALDVARYGVEEAKRMPARANAFARTNDVLRRHTVCREHRSSRRTAACSERPPRTECRQR